MTDQPADDEIVITKHVREVKAHAGLPAIRRTVEFEVTRNGVQLTPDEMDRLLEDPDFCRTLAEMMQASEE